MPRDIRSYFNVSPKTSKQIDDGDKKKKTKNIIISDSESDDEIVELKKISPKKRVLEKRDEGKNKKNEKSPYFSNLKPINPADVFGSSSIKRSGVPVKKKKNAVTDFKNKKVTDVKNKKSFEDDDFDATFLQLDDKSVELLTGEKSSGNLLEKCSDSKLEKATNSEKTPEKRQEHLFVSGGTSEGYKNKNLSKRKISSKSEGYKNDCSVLSESSDSECDVTVAKKMKIDKPTVISFIKSPKNKPVTSPEKKVNCGIKKNECMDLSESDSEQETSSTINQSNPQKVKDKLCKKFSSSPEEEKFLVINEQKGSQKRQHDAKRLNSIDNSVNQKKQKKEIFKDKQSPAKESNPVPRVPIISSLWVDKYKPTNLKQVIGQQGDKSNVKKLINWLQKWKKNHSGKTKLNRPSPWAKDDDGAFFKAALLSGPPGVGKTTTAHLVCKELGFDVVEFNASDTRSKKSLQQEVSELLSTKSLAPFFSGGQEQEVTSKHVLLMDEVDGMAGNEDRGGIQELIQLIRSARVPVICMCNDRNHPKIRSLVNYCFDLRFSRPRVEQIKGAMMTVCYKEGLKVTPEQLNDIIKSTNQDIRLVLNHLSVLAAQKDKNLRNSEKFVKLGPWDVVRKVFSEDELKKMSFYDKSDLFFFDYSIAPLFVQENYLSVVPHAKLNKIEKMKVFAKAAESICTGDITEKVIRTSNAWSLLPVEAIFASVVPGETLKGHMGGQINFPSWLGKNSTKNKMDRLLQELLIHTRLRVSGSKEAINLDYCSHLRDLIVRPLIQNGSEGVQDALNALQNYDLLKEDLESLTELCKWPNKKDPIDKIESKVKAAFTRAYNKSTSLSPYAVTATIKKGRGGGTGSSTEIDASDLLVEDVEAAVLGEVEEEEDADNIEVDAMIVAKKKTSKKQETPSTSKQRGTGRRGGRGGKK